MAPRSEHLAGFIDALEALPFVQEVRLGRTQGSSRSLAIKAGNKRFERLAVQKLSYLDRSTVHALRALASKSEQPLILFARYLPRAIAEEFMDAGIDFLDQAGNIHLTLGPRFARTVIGRTQPAKPERERALTPAQVQVQLALVADPELLKRSVRDIAGYAGLSKSMAANIRKRLERPASIQTNQRAEDNVPLGEYATILRPKLLLGRFRGPDKTTDAFLHRLHAAADKKTFRFALTGGAAAARLQRFYKAPEVALFLDTWNERAREELRLLPDRQGPITLLRAFGRLVYWKEVDDFMLAHPCLIYAELMTSADPRAHEAALELREEYLTR